MDRPRVVLRTLTIFIDGLPFDQLSKMEFVRTFPSQARLVPILGYSVNCQTQLFTGKTPDEMGYWCEWTYDPERAPFKKLKLFLRLLALLAFSYPLKRVLHKMLDRLRWVSSTKNIPLAYLADFAETGHSVFNPRFSHDSLLDFPGLHKIFHLHFPAGMNRDDLAFHAAKNHILQEKDPGHIVVTWTQIDACSHWDGVGSQPYDRLLEKNDRHIKELTNLFLAKVPDGVVFVVSDHGMVNVQHSIRVDLEGRFGKPHRAGYAYFSEGTILRVWCRDAALRDQIAKYLNSLEGLESVSDAERVQFGIVNPAFGDLIYHALEGYQLVPSYWGPKPSVGMHGYHPRYRSQHGVCLSTRPGDFADEASATDFYRKLCQFLRMSA